MNPVVLNQEEILKKVAAVPFWWHSIQLTPEIVTPGHKTPDLLEKELASLKIPPLSGKAVLDIGAWDGFYSLMAERMGAEKIVALDHYVWSIDWKEAWEQVEESKRTGKILSHWESLQRVWKPESLPGKKGFNTVTEILQSKVESIVADFMTADLNALGQFDVVFFLGVLYHMQNPLESLKKLSQVTKELAIIETEAIALPGFENYALAEFYETDELNGDPSNWWAPNLKALSGMCRAAGFSRIEPTLIPPPFGDLPHPYDPPPPPSTKSLIKKLIKRLIGRDIEPPPVKIQPMHYRAIVHAWK